MKASIRRRTFWSPIFPPGIWDKNIALDPRAWWWHSEGWREYGVAFKEGNEDHSFVLIRGDHPVALVTLLLTRNAEGHPELSFNGDPLAWPLTRDRWARGEVFRRVDELATKTGARRVLFRGNPLGPDPDDLQYFLAHGYRDISWQTRIIDLAMPLAALWLGVRKSYKTLIHRAERTHQIVVDDVGRLAEAYRDLHRASEAGQHLPRPRRTYDLQAEWMKSGHGILIGARHKGGQQGRSQDGQAAQGSAGEPPSTTLSVDGWVAFMYLIKHKGAAYYVSGPSLVPDVMHALQWAAMKELKLRGVRRYEIGWIGHGTTEKERNVEVFKTGFGGRTVFLPVVEKVFS